MPRVRAETPLLGQEAYPWRPDQGDGTFRNPILLADYSDPDVVRVDGDYYLVSSSFNCTPALPILHSRDLVNWTLINHAVKNLPDARYQQVQSGAGVWAPSIRFHDGRYWIFFPLPDEGIYVTTAADPRGAWSEPHLVQAGCGLIRPVSALGRRWSRLSGLCLRAVAGRCQGSTAGQPDGTGRVSAAGRRRDCVP